MRTMVTDTDEYFDWIEEHLKSKCRKTESDARKRRQELAKPNFQWRSTLLKYLRTDRSMKQVSIDSTMTHIKQFAQRYPDLNVVSIDQMEKAMTIIRETYSANTITNIRSAVRHWYCSIMDIRKVFDDDVKHILRLPKKSARRLTERSQLLTIPNLEEIIRRSYSNTWKAIWGLDWDMAFRPGELCRLRYEDLKFDDQGYYLSLRRSKSESPETHYLMTWLSFKYFMPYYRAHHGEGLMFTTRNGTSITPRKMEDVIKNYIPKIGKHLYPYLVRESASTWWYNAGLLDIQSIKKRMGHNPRSTTFESHYLMLFPEDYNEAVLVASGDSVPEKEPYIQLKCKKCKTINPPKSEECFYCHAVLDPRDGNFGEVAKAYELQEENERLQQELNESSVEQMKMIDEKYTELERRMEEKMKEIKKGLGAS